MEENVWCVDGKHHGHDKKCLILDPDPYSYLNIIKLNCQIFTPKIGPQYKYYITECRVMHCTVP